MTYKEIIKKIDGVKKTIEKTFAECMDLGEEYEPIKFEVDMSQVYSPCNKEGGESRVEDAWRLGSIEIKLKKENFFPLYGLSRFLSLVNPPRQISSDPDEFIFEQMMIDNDGSITFFLDAERMFEIFGKTKENP
ncbi:MAG: hypothetical protein IJV33_06845 [Bacteroidaceae bacterium]|nr:hypothetical protein [Bacteroidaceae bacterium]